MEEIIEKNASEQYKYDMAVYSVETNRRRSFPDYKDGLKLVHRRALFVMAFHEPCKRKYVKTAQVVGKVMGDFHPHGDTSIADAIKLMANWFDRYIPLIKSESNMGSMQGDGAAAMRYTEVMLSDFAIEAIFKDMSISPDVVTWTKNYTGTDKEPEYLPVAVPLLLINGTLGMGVGKSVSIPPHNINEVLDATIKLIDDPSAPVVLIPDQCMPCEIIDTNWKQICNTGNGVFKVRSIIDIETFNKGKTNEHYALVIKSTPDQCIIDDGKGNGIIYQMNKLIEQGKLPQVTDIFEDSHGNDMRVVVHLKKGSDPEYVRTFLYNSTNLQTTKNVNFEVLDDLELVRMSYKSYLQAFIEQRKLTKFRLYCMKLQDVRTSLHEKELYIKIIRSGKIDEVISRIRKSKLTNDKDLIEWMIKFLDVTDVQAKFILNCPTKRLAPMYLREYEEDVKSYKIQEKNCMDHILDEGIILQEIKDELLYFKKKYGFPRKSRVISQNEIDHIPQGTFNVVITENNFIRKLPVNEPISAPRGDNPMQVICIDNTSDLLLIASQGRIYKIPVHKIPITEKSAVGVDIRILIKGITSTVIGLFDYNQVLELSKKVKQKWYAVICTSGNYIKKLNLEDLLIATPGGITLTKLNNGDAVKEVKIIPDNIDIVIYSDRKALRCKMSDIPNYKRNTIGVYAMNTTDKIDGISAIDPSVTDIVVITESGKVNKFNISGLATSDRYKAGSSVIKLGTTDRINSLFGAKDSDIIHVTTRNSKYDFVVKDIPRLSSVATGNKMIPLKGDAIVKCSIEY